MVEVAAPNAFANDTERNAGFVASEAQGKRNAVERYIISNCPDYTKNKASTPKGSKKDVHCVAHLFVATSTASKLGTHQNEVILVGEGAFGGKKKGCTVFLCDLDSIRRHATWLG